MNKEIEMLIEKAATSCLDKNITVTDAIEHLLYSVIKIAKDNDAITAELQKENKQLNKTIEDAENCLVCAGTADPFEIVQNTINILSKKVN